MKIFSAIIITMLVALLGFLALMPAIMGDCIDLQACEHSKRTAVFIVLGGTGALWVLAMWLIFRRRRSPKAPK